MAGRSPLGRPRGGAETLTFAVSRVQRSVNKSAFTRVFDALWRCRTGTLPHAAFWNGPGSAVHHCVLHRVRDTCLNNSHDRIQRT